MRPAGQVNAPLAPEVEALRAVPFFAELTSDDLRRVAAVGRRLTFSPGQALFTKGDVGVGLFVILSGTASIHIGGAEHRLGPGSFVGEMSLLSGRGRAATVVATDTVEVMAIEAVSFRAFLLKNPSVAVTILAEVAERLREVQDRVDTGDEVSRGAGRTE
jgi:CRP-like cAMP-binding protein